MERSPDAAPPVRRRGIPVATRAAAIRITILLALLALGLAWFWAGSIRMPGEKWRGSLPAATADEQRIEKELRRIVKVLAGDIGERNMATSASLTRAVTFIRQELAASGYAVAGEPYTARGAAVVNLVAEKRGVSRPEEIVVVGAHYDTAEGTPGANDNAGGVAAMLVLARDLAKRETARTVRFVAFVNEEPPFFLTADMGSLVHARLSKAQGDRVTAMVSLETMGYFTDGRNSQDYPYPLSLFYPKEGNFIGIVGNTASAKLVKRAVKVFRAATPFPCEGAALPGKLPGVGWSDHWSFWQQGWQAVMVTDTAPFRYPHYHKTTDTPDKLVYDRMARVIAGLLAVVSDLASGS